MPEEISTGHQHLANCNAHTQSSGLTYAIHQYTPPEVAKAHRIVGGPFSFEASMTPATTLALFLVAPILLACVRLVEVLADGVINAIEIMTQYE